MSKDKNQNFSTVKELDGSPTIRRIIKQASIEHLDIDEGNYYQKMQAKKPTNEIQR